MEEGEPRTQDFPNIGLKDSVEPQRYPPQPIPPPPPPQTMYPPRPWRFIFESRTEKGLRIMKRGLKLIGIFWAIIVTILIIINSFDNMGFAAAFILIPFVLAAIVFFLASVITLIHGICLLYTGRREFGPVHAHYAGLGLIFSAMFFLFFIAQNFILIIFAFRIGMNFIVLSVALGIISTMILSAAWIYFILDLIPNDIKHLLWVSVVLSLVVSIITSIASRASNFAGTLGMILWFPLLVLIFYCYYRTHKRLLRREIQPIFPPPIPMPFPPQGFNRI
jgi:hypothetical protein